MPSTDLPPATSVAAQLETILAGTFQPTHLALRDDSAHHHGHPEATARGGRHYKLTLVSTTFEGLSRLARERAVQAALAPWWQAGQLHALSCKLFTPAEWAARQAPTTA